MNTVLSFAPVVVERDVEVISRPSLSYWKDAWIRLKANRRALVSLYIIIALGVFTVVGPLFAPDPSAQDLDQISSPPGADRRALIVAPYAPWSGVTVNVPSGDGPLAAPLSVSQRRKVLPVATICRYSVSTTLKGISTPILWCMTP